MLSWFVLSVLAIARPRYNKWLAKLWVVFSVPLVPFLVLLNGIVPVTLIPLATIIPIMLLSGPWRLIPVLAITLSTLIVPLSPVPFDYAIWLRLCITNFMVAAMVMVLVRYLQKALVDSMDKSDALKEALHSARQANQTQTQFLATMSHEIRTPMNGILGLVESALATEVSDTQRDYLEKVMRSGQVLQGILNDILDSSKLTAGKLVIENVPFSVQRVLEDVEAVFVSSAAQKSLELQIHLSESVWPVVVGDPMRLSQVLSNLISNAIKFTQHGNMVLSVAVVEQDEKQQTLRFSVADTGIGIPVQHRDEIFSPFTQADGSTARQFGGTGLGLQIARNLVENMGGRLILENSLTSNALGSEFSFCLAFQASNEQPVNQVDGMTDVVNQFDGRALVVDDNEINQVVAKNILMRYGLKVAIVSGGKEAIAACQRIHFDVVFMDLHMPEMDGFQAATQIHQTHPNVPIVALTAAVLKPDVDKARAAGMHHHLAKPIDHDALRKVLLAIFTTP
ncbi:ATP-binding protein [Alteromonas oceanisediminis]|uniref:ATP-binding protein n=1 Tax=Alteromonas oceanisediminis TaxID=2836180 RepID=UPI0020239D6E|nr:ATP-binding protein [Alteromonas oceanisediminis]